MRRWLSRLLFFACVAPAAATPLRVGLFQNELPQTLSVSCASGFQLIDGKTGSVLHTVDSGRTVQFENREGRLWILWGSENLAASNSLRLEPLQRKASLTVASPRGPKR